jgi:hypothetical protein
MENKNKEILDKFIEFCETHPEYRFWQALHNFCGSGYVMIGNKKDELADTFYFKELLE